MDNRIVKLADNLVNYSMEVKPGDKVYIDYIGADTEPLARALIKEVYKAGGVPFPHFTSQRVLREILLNCTKEQLEFMAKRDSEEMDAMDCYVAVRGTENVAELSDVPSENMKMYELYYRKPVHSDRRVPNTRWVVLRYPNASMAQLSDTSQDAFEDFYYDVCTLDYSKMEEAMKPLVKLMEKTDKVRLVCDNGTDLTFSIKDIPVIPCAGHMNIPDGEVFTAPVKDSVNGVIHYNTPSPYQGVTYEDVVLEFKDGKIVNATSNYTEKINKIFDTDEGARYVGEFAIGVNPYITKPMKDILFDEKIMGSIHFTPGSSYDEAPNGNKSSVHWDLVLIMTPEFGGGEIYFDDVLVRKDGRFIIDELECLNPENLK